jgi:hypothetical protein
VGCDYHPSLENHQARCYYSTSHYELGLHRRPCSGTSKKELFEGEDTEVLGWAEYPVAASKYADLASQLLLVQWPLETEEKPEGYLPYFPKYFEMGCGVVVAAEELDWHHIDVELQMGCYGTPQQVAA